MIHRPLLHSGRLLAGLFLLTTIWAQAVEVVVTHPSMDQRHAYSATSRTTGPNVFSDSRASKA